MSPLIAPIHALFLIDGYYTTAYRKSIQNISRTFIVILPTIESLSINIRKSFQLHQQKIFNEEVICSSAAVAPS